MPAKGYRKQFCINGHDTFVCGREKSGGGCSECNKLRQRKDPSKNSAIHQFCPKGHDTFICGRYKNNGECKECRKEREKKRHKRRYKPHPGPFKRFCPRGHDKDIVGRTSQGRCLPCSKILPKEWHQENIEKCKLRGKLRYLNIVNNNTIENQNILKVMSQHSRMHHWRVRGVKNFDGTIFKIEDYEIAFNKQEGKCGICGRHRSELKRNLAVDHDHITGFFRGLLCSSCNVLLGKYEKNGKNLKRYLISHQKEKSKRGSK
jgi:hypothetical protein